MSQPYSGYIYDTAPYTAQPFLSTAPRNNEEQYDSVSEKEQTRPRVVTHCNTKGSFHIFSTALFIVWTVLIGVELFLLEKSVALAPTVVHLPWRYSNSGLPSVLNTVFTQGHAHVTAMHLSRLYMSGLQSHYGSPLTWIEMFWIAKQNWSGPIGIVNTALSMIGLRIRVSFTFIFFSLISLVALFTPVFLNQAYPIDTLDVSVPRPFNSSTLSLHKILGIDAYAQMGAGRGTWATNQSVTSIFNATTFTSIHEPRNQSSSNFFAGDARGMDVFGLPGILIQGGCEPVANQPNLSDYSVFSEYCHQNLDFSFSTEYTGGIKTLAPESINLNVSYCINAEFDSRALPSTRSAFLWFDDHTGMVTEAVKGLIVCNASTSIGTASVFGRNLTYSRFQQDDTLYDTANAQGGEPLQDPLFAALYALLIDAGGSDTEDAQLFTSLGYAEVTDASHAAEYVPPSLDGLADAMWRGATHMALAMSLLSQDSGALYSAIEHVPVSGRTRNKFWFLVAISLLGAWVVSLGIITLLMLRRTAYGDSFDSYVASRLVANRPDLIEGDASGGLNENKRLLEKFDPAPLNAGR
ncbi:hypothetical protein BDW22DRAFT_1352456 [Trametopsis cervina]|nr:hypothetical protein BDW22DRAFT_1352456 [Trametopsis cervina]